MFMSHKMWLFMIHKTWLHTSNKVNILITGSMVTMRVAIDHIIVLSS